MNKKKLIEIYDVLFSGSPLTKEQKMKMESRRYEIMDYMRNLGFERTLKSYYMKAELEVINSLTYSEIDSAGELISCNIVISALVAAGIYTAVLLTREKLYMTDVWELPLLKKCLYQLRKVNAVFNFPAGLVSNAITKTMSVYSEYRESKNPRELASTVSSMVFHHLRDYITGEKK